MAVYGMAVYDALGRETFSTGTRMPTLLGMVDVTMTSSGGGPFGPTSGNASHAGFANGTPFAILVEAPIFYTTDNSSGFPVQIYETAVVQISAIVSNAFTWNLEPRTYEGFTHPKIKIVYGYY